METWGPCLKTVGPRLETGSQHLKTGNLLAIGNVLFVHDIVTLADGLSTLTVVGAVSGQRDEEHGREHDDFDECDVSKLRRNKLSRVRGDVDRGTRADVCC